MARRRKRSNGSRKRKLPLIGLAVAGNIANEMRMPEAFEHLKNGNFSAALGEFAVASPERITKSMGLGIGLGLARSAFGPVTIFSGKKGAITLF